MHIACQVLHHIAEESHQHLSFEPSLGDLRAISDWSIELRAIHVDINSILWADPIRVPISAPYTEPSIHYALDFQPRCNQVSQQQSTAGASPGSLWLIKGLFFGAVDCFYQSSPRMINIRRNDTMHRSSKGVCTIASCSNQLYNCVDSSQSRAVVHYYVSIKGSGTLLRVNQGQWYNTTCRKHSSWLAITLAFRTGQLIMFRASSHHRALNITHASGNQNISAEYRTSVIIQLNIYG